MHKTVINKDRDTAVREIASYLLDSGRIGAVFSLKKFKGAESVDYGLITDSALLENILPFYPIMPQNAGQTLSRFTKMTKPVLAVIRPCEFRAFVETVKRAQGDPDNFITVTYTCGGVIPLLDHAKGLKKNAIGNYYKSVAEGKNPENIRENCARCEHFYPENADILVSVIGARQDRTEIVICNDKTKNMLDGSGITLEERNFDKAVLNNIIEERSALKKEKFASADRSGHGLAGLVDIFGRCVGCRGCNSVCPICYCTQCDFASSNFDYNRAVLEKELDQKGALRLPPDTIFFHIGRMSHMAFSCVGCGQCSDVCPAGIPVGVMFNKAGEAVAAEFDFIPGRNVEEKIPVMLYKEQEFPEMGE